MLNDSDIWKSIQLSDEKAFTQLFNRYSAILYKTAWNYIQDGEVCEQIVHDLFLSLWTNRKSLEIKSFRSYLTSAARYQVYKYITQAKVHPIVYKDKIEEINNYFTINNGYYALAENDLEKQLDSHLENLPKRCREVFLLSRKELLTNEEISLKLGISKRSVENQITNALKHIRLSFKDICMILMIIQMGK